MYNVSSSSICSKFFLKEIKIKTEKGKEDYKSFLFSHSVQRAYEQLMLMFT